MLIYSSFHGLSGKFVDNRNLTFSMKLRANHRSNGSIKQLIQNVTSQIYNRIAFSLHSSLMSNRYFELGRSNKVSHRFRLLFFQTDNFITNSSSIASILVTMYQEELHLLIIGNFTPPKLPLEHTENGRSLRFPPIRRVNLLG